MDLGFIWLERDFSAVDLQRNPSVPSAPTTLGASGKQSSGAGGRLRQLWLDPGRLLGLAVISGFLGVVLGSGSACTGLFFGVFGLRVPVGLG
ncbi:hypothetical protein F3Y22_tig00117016pilonHSYRG00671 [Hibiscus syriacus]|uniref:Uncharacterized protein n=1 Tax=Hibiscus syriacus TaxID=106335 RepID=A0A6A2X231_HIBSY|nr:hypothetical protein F3Y22_tig00117016pilonHSYRG00671 [Hibiscus syriacus]